MDGYLMMVLVSIIHSIPPIAIRYSYASTNALTSQTLWFFSAFLWSLFYRRKISFKTPVLIFSLLNVISLLIFFFSINVLGASVVSFIGKSETLFIVFFGLLLFKERFTSLEIFGFIIAIAGIFLISYSEERVQAAYALLALSGFLINAYAFSIVKQNKDIDPRDYVFTRAFFVFLITGAITYASGSFVLPEVNTAWIFILLPLISAVIAQRMQYSAMKKTHFGKAGLIKNISPLLTLVLAYVFLGEVLSYRQMAGGLFIIGGVSIILITKDRK